MPNLDKKIILITGAAAGIGCATAKLAAAQGATVFMADIDIDAGEKAAAEVNATYLHVDIADELSVQAMVAAVKEKYAHLDVLINAAGILKGAYVPLGEFNIATWREVMDINTTGTFLCAKHAAALMRNAGRGVMILISSLAAVGGSSSFAYGASKGGVNALALCLEHSLAKDNIRVNVVMPGNIDTGMKRSVIATEAEQRNISIESAVSALKLGNPEGVARVLVWLASDEANYVRGVICTR
jgi:NAD(P)-dependent dehydrogenase (short-subunit alcohol dehydrogenase family)